MTEKQLKALRQLIEAFMIYGGECENCPAHDVCEDDYKSCYEKIENYILKKEV